MAIEQARGRYVIFIDAGDCIIPSSLLKLYNIAEANQVDVLRGKLKFQLSDNRNYDHSFINESQIEILSGVEAFVLCQERNDYQPAIYSYLYKTDWIRDRNVRFDGDSNYWDELWIQKVFCSVEKVALVQEDFYCYRERKAHITQIKDHYIPADVEELFRIGHAMWSLAEQYDSGIYRILKSWIYVNAARIYAAAFYMADKIRNFSISIHAQQVPDFLNIKAKMESRAWVKYQEYYSIITYCQKEYQAWYENPCDTALSQLPEESLHQKRLILIYNSPSWQDYTDVLDQLPPGYVLTSNRKYLNQAFAVVFYLPGLFEHIHEDINKPENQIWISWNMECDDNFTWMKQDSIMAVFDLHMNYHQDADVCCCYYAGFKENEVLRSININSKKNRACMLISSSINHSRRKQLLTELMKYTTIDSYGKLMNNKSMGNDTGIESKLQLYAQYKFVIAFENAIGLDYVTEKLYHPLLAGSVPIYLGAPNVSEFLPGADCVVQAAQFSSVKALAQYIEKCYADETIYLRHHVWRLQPWHDDFLLKVSIQEQSPFIRLCKLLDERYPRRRVNISGS